MPNNRSDAALRERLELAEKAVQEVGTTLWKDYQTAPRELCILDAFNERILTMEDYTEVATARHIAANSPDVVRADIEEILRLRGEVERLEKEADWLAASAANAGWNGVRVSPSFMREKARKAVKDEENG